MSPRVVDLRGGSRRPASEPAPEPKRKPSVPRERRSSLREKRRRYRAVITAAVCVCLLLSTYAVHVASYLPRFTYQHGAVTGAATLLPAEIQKFTESELAKANTGFISGRNIFLYKFSALEFALRVHYPSIKNVSVSRDTSLGNGIVVAIEERMPFARWCKLDSECYQIDDTGTVYAPMTGATSTLSTQYVFMGPLSTSTPMSAAPAPLGEVFAYSHFPGMIALLKGLGEQGHVALGASVQNEQDFYVILQEGFYIKASYGQDANALVRNLKLVLTSDSIKDKIESLEYVDLRFGNRVYYKLEGQPQSE